jgi:hypothetical protein
MKAEHKKEIASATLRITRITTSFNDDTDDNLSNIDDKVIRNHCKNSKINLKSTISKYTKDPSRSKIFIKKVNFNHCASDSGSDGLDILDDQFPHDLTSII